MPQWTFDVATIGSAFTDYGAPVDFFFYKRLNALGLFGSVVSLDGAALPTRGQVVRFTWDKAGTPRIHFEGIITDVREHTNVGMASVRGFDLLGPFWQASHAAQAATGKTVREYSATTPYNILTTNGTPKGLLYDSQGTQIMALGSGATDAVDNVNQGTALDFRADSGRALQNLQRLALQARYNGSTYGLEFYGKLGGAGGTTPQLHVVKRRTTGAAETWNIPDTLFQARRGTEGMTAAQAIRVVGSGDGRSRVESTLVGSGGLEGVVADKTLMGATEATNMANRLSDLLNPSTEVVTGVLFDHGHVSDLGDTLTVTQTGKGNITPRLFDVSYVQRSRGFVVTLGRPRPVDQDPLFNLIGLAGGQAHGPQTSDLKPVQTQPTGATATGPSGGATTVADGATSTIATVAIPSSHLDAHGYAWAAIVQLDADVAGHVRWDITATGDSLDIATFTATGMKANKNYKMRGYFPFALSTAGNYELTVTNNSGGNITVPLNGTTITVYEKPRFRVNA